MSTDPHDLVRALEEDLAALAAADLDLERDAEVAERTRIERGQVPLLDRLRAADGVVGVTLLGGAEHLGQVLEAGDGWVLLSLGHRDDGRPPLEHLVRLDAVASVRGLGRAASPAQPIARSFASVLRAWCRDRSTVAAALLDGAAVDGPASAVWADHLELAGPRGAVVLPCAAIAAITRCTP